MDESEKKNDTQPKPWYKSIASVLLVILLSPVILMGLVFAGVIILKDLITRPARKRKYEGSAYFRDLGVPFQDNPEDDPAYSFYNEVSEKGLPFTFVHQPDNGLEYLVRDGKVFLFPWFEGMALTDTDDGARWMICDGVSVADEMQPLDEALAAQRAKLDAQHAGLPCVVMVTDAYLLPRNFDDEGESDRWHLPKNVVWGKDFVTAYLGRDAGESEE